jgi:methanogenic corrinoid protein MtbC1
MLQQEKLIQALEEARIRIDEKIMVGGAPMTEVYAKKIGADGYAEDAASAVNLVFRPADALI